MHVSHLQICFNSLYSQKEVPFVPNKKYRIAGFYNIRNSTRKNFSYTNFSEMEKSLNLNPVHYLNTRANN